MEEQENFKMKITQKMMDGINGYYSLSDLFTDAIIIIFGVALSTAAAIYTLAIPGEIAGAFAGWCGLPPNLFRLPAMVFGGWFYIRSANEEPWAQILSAIGIILASIFFLFRY